MMDLLSLPHPVQNGMTCGNIFEGVPENLRDELTQVIWHRQGLRIERIVSRGQQSPDDFWYDQDEDEWVLVLSGRARLQLETGERLVTLGPGDYLEIPAHERHRVDWTDPDSDTIWLAIFSR